MSFAYSSAVNANIDPNTIIDNATWKDPHQYPTGISWVIVNGAISIDHRIWTEKLSGKVLIHTP